MSFLTTAAQACDTLPTLDESFSPLVACNISNICVIFVDNFVIGSRSKVLNWGFLDPQGAYDNFLGGSTVLCV